MKRIVSIQDISCLGKCSLTVALPILSACGVETAVMPTAVLSTHTGGFTGYTYRDLTDDMLPMAEHWKKEAAPSTRCTAAFWAAQSRSASWRRFSPCSGRRGPLWPWTR